MLSLSIFFNICDIQNKIHMGVKTLNETPLYDYNIGLDECRRPIYMSVEVRPDSLDKGSDPTDFSCPRVVIEDTRGNHAAQFIGKRLGGSDEPHNVFPLNSMLDTSKWQFDEDLVYEHLKKGDNRHARLMYGIGIDEDSEVEARRPIKIYYHLKLYENGEAIGQAIEGMFENISPRITNENF